MKGVCSHCYRYTEVAEKGVYLLCDEHKELKQYQSKEKKKSRLNPISKAQRKSLDNKKKAYEYMKKNKAQVCTGCGTTENLTHSHLIPISQRKDLEANLVNLTYHCMDCHTIWEHDKEERKKLLDYDVNMLRIKQLDEGYFNLITNE